MSFIRIEDYDTQINPDIRNVLVKDYYQLKRAEDTAISQIRNWLSGRYDCDVIFTPAPTDGSADTRDQHIVTITIDIALYHLYSQTGNKDVPLHRKERYADALDWLREAGKGMIGTALPLLHDSTSTGGDVVIKSRPPENHRW